MLAKVVVLCGDALEMQVDVLALKFAQRFYGVDALVNRKLTEAGRQVHFLEPWEICFEKSIPGIAASQILFVGVPPLHDFKYREIRTFGRKVLSSLAKEAPGTQSLAITVHGPGYGLDEVEAFEAEVAGIIDAIQSGDSPISLKKIIIVEINRNRAQRLQQLLTSLLPGGTIENKSECSIRPDADTTERLRAAGYASEAKPHVFVAMPFKEDMDDVYHYGIQNVVRAAGFLCERADLATFTGDVLEWVRNRIKNSTLVVADLTDANPNVYLEVGYAWGCGVPTVLIVRDTQYLKFDVRGQRCLIYKRIKDLEESLGKELARLSVYSAV